MEYSSQGTALCASETKEGTFKKLYGFYQFPDMGGDTDKLDVTNFNDKNKRTIDSKLADYGSLQFNFYYNRESADDASETDVLETYKYLKTAQSGGKSLWFKLTDPDGSYNRWKGGVSVKRTGAGVAEALKFTLTTTVESEMEESFE